MTIIARAFCWTLNNPPSNEINWTSLDDVRYAVWQLERGEETGTPHLQGYTEFTKAVTWTRIKNLLGRTVHIEQRRGTREQARDYCMKPDTRLEGPWEFGIWELRQGKRTDIDEVCSLVDDGYTEKDICNIDRNLWAKTYKVIERYILLNSPQRNWRSKTILVHGDPGTGKSTYCKNKAGADVYFKDDTIWWPGYAGQEAVVFDEFEGAIDITNMNRICDSYPLCVQIKGGAVSFTSKMVYINSNLDIDSWKSGWEKLTHYKLESFKRRIDEWLIFRKIDLIFIEITHIFYDVEAPNHPEITRETHRFNISSGWEEMNNFLYPPPPEPSEVLSEDNSGPSPPPSSPEGGVSLPPVSSSAEIPPSPPRRSRRRRSRAL